MLVRAITTQRTVSCAWRPARKIWYFPMKPIVGGIPPSESMKKSME
jgi:hypothetical protein